MTTESSSGHSLFSWTWHKRTTFPSAVYLEYLPLTSCEIIVKLQQAMIRRIDISLIQPHLIDLTPVMCVTEGQGPLDLSVFLLLLAHRRATVSHTVRAAQQQRKRCDLFSDVYEHHLNDSLLHHTQTGPCFYNSRVKSLWLTNRKPINTSECSGQASTDLCHRKTSMSPGQDGTRTGASAQFSELIIASNGPTENETLLFPLSTSESSFQPHRAPARCGINALFFNRTVMLGLI
ncbi:unnamed protein product [Leuciscus chuanchicus]